ncbi:BAQ_1a_G0037990.mRNA.1.CDS.1 [Saccharomyces cerevisiae]|nr:BAQ_1a_G0037990.mRNA.1.CDS.1 [Saccharomyces cerevisiae]CAI4664385.1 BAM_G0037990.mRNA.1.CDS.1 [Saccharomyces cerevisiae]CAI7243754.1 BAM_G0037990.mRNA.1.CDS.1 [Saccharomyces cerevisiae]CAI7244342.1 BAQ_1a_G0037990.mRNA.1.CDS.1 [Saccharomyces cerevisiae]
MLQIPFDVFGLDCFNVDAFLFIVGSVFFFSPVSASLFIKKGAAFGVSNSKKICVTLIVNELI